MRKRTYVIIFCVLLFVGVISAWLVRRDAISSQINKRYDQLYAAIQSTNYASAKDLMAPAVRERMRRNYEWFRGFIRQRTVTSRVRLGDSTALVIPETRFHHLVIPGGNSIELVKIDGEWYFTGEVNID